MCLRSRAASSRPASPVGILVIIRDMPPLAKEWDKSPKRMLHICDKLITFGGPWRIFEHMKSCLYLLDAMLTKKRWEHTNRRIHLGCRQMSRLSKCIEEEVTELSERGTVCMHDITFCHSDHPTSPANTLILVQELSPIPGAQITHSQALINQIK